MHEKNNNTYFNEGFLEFKKKEYNTFQGHLTYNPGYKRYWKLLLKNEEDLDDTNKFYSKNFKKKVTQKYIVTYLINKNPIIYSSYNYYQGILKAIKKKDKNKFINIIHHLPKKQVSQYINKTNKIYYLWVSKSFSTLNLELCL